ncbi:OLC1v1003309C1 [Oldenlandia corymbosa var. corymbosa]|uniref:OLC1v1003309C1 n=1 Tax=Oldenlandia corymbosa var. corymbosa TaxID=529605 RepID=A0AAV1DAE5_OLDCO|nr:OLC1v1003309C1 [Oldenlandia corymbosa var. corymbosa]
MAKMATISSKYKSFPTLFLIIIIILFQTCLHNCQAGLVDDIGVAICANISVAGVGVSVGNNCSPEAEVPAPLAPPPAPAPTPYPPLQFESERIKLVYQAIQDLKAKIKYDPQNITVTWVGSDICNKYKGFRCAVVPGFGVNGLSDVQFNGFNFGGPELTLDGFIEKLPDLSIFHANSNGFTGLIPRQITDIPYLFELDLSNNKLTGQFPYQVLGATNLTFLDIRFNSFSGAVPPQVFTLDVDVLFINNNNFQQQIPANLFSIPAIYVTLANNKFTGSIPGNIGKASKTLSEVLFLNNQLTGCLPPEIGLLNKATVFDVSQNQLTGPIPCSFGCLTNMEILNLANNQFYGIVPDEVCNLPNLKKLTLSYNYFTGIGLACEKLIKNGVLDVSQNCIAGFPNQRPVKDCLAFGYKPKWCPNHQLKDPLNWIPCRQGGPRRMTRSISTGAAFPVSYNALQPQRL